MLFDDINGFDDVSLGLSFIESSVSAYILSSLMNDYVVVILELLYCSRFLHGF